MIKRSMPFRVADGWPGMPAERPRPVRFQGGQPTRPAAADTASGVAKESGGLVWPGLRDEAPDTTPGLRPSAPATPVSFPVRDAVIRDVRAISRRWRRSPGLGG